jgi:hypothetical protein
MIEPLPRFQTFERYRRKNLSGAAMRACTGFAGRYLSCVFHRLGQVLLIAAVLAASGGHWAVLQSVAWANMLAANLRAYSLSDAIERTFNGKHPCCLCSEISKGKQTEKKSDIRVELKKMEFLSARAVFVFTPHRDFEWIPMRDSFGLNWMQEPPVPPPRSLAA